MAGDLELVPSPLPIGVTDPVRRLVAAWLLGYASTATRRAYTADMTAWLGFGDELGTSPLEARQVHVDAWPAPLVTFTSEVHGAAVHTNSSTANRGVCHERMTR